MLNSSDLATNIFRLSTVLGRIADCTLQDGFNCGISQFKILWMLHTHSDGVLQTTIAGWLNQTEAAVSRQVGLLEQEKLIIKKVDPKNRRNHIIILSEKGSKLAQKAMQTLQKEYQPYFDELSVVEQAELNRMLEKIFFSIVTKLHKEGK